MPCCCEVIVHAGSNGACVGVRKGSPVGLVEALALERHEAEELVAHLDGELQGGLRGECLPYALKTHPALHCVSSEDHPTSQQHANPRWCRRGRLSEQVRKGTSAVGQKCNPKSRTRGIIR